MGEQDLVSEKDQGRHLFQLPGKHYKLISNLVHQTSSIMFRDSVRQAMVQGDDWVTLRA